MLDNTVCVCVYVKTDIGIVISWHDIVISWHDIIISWHDTIILSHVWFEA